MGKIFRTAALAGITAVAMSGGASALTISGGTYGTIPGGTAVNDVLSGIFGVNSIGGYYGSAITGGSATYEYLGYEASFINTLYVDGGLVFTNNTTPVGATSSQASLNFRFDVDGASGSVANGSNPDDSGHTSTVSNFFATCGLGQEMSRSCGTVYVFLDDAGAGPDDNHDDMAISISAVPLPAALPMLFAAFGGLGLMARRRKS